MGFWPPRIQIYRAIGKSPRPHLYADAWRNRRTSAVSSRRNRAYENFAIRRGQLGFANTKLAPPTGPPFASQISAPRSGREGRHRTGRVLRNLRNSLRTGCIGIRLRLAATISTPPNIKTTINIALTCPNALDSATRFRSTREKSANRPELSNYSAPR